MAWADASQRLEEMPDARSRCDSSIPDSSSISTPTAAACRCRYQSLTAGGMIKTTSDLTREPSAPIRAWVCIGLGGEDDFRHITLPVLDLYGENDFPAVLQSAQKRAALIKN